jgi:ADP-ribose pyrophosphatase
VFKGKIFSIVWEELTLGDGTQVTYETVDAPDVVRVYPVRGNELLLIREHRAELGRTVLRTVSGRIEPGEDPIGAAMRELREELGCDAANPRVFATSRPILKVESDVHHVLADVVSLGSQQLEAGEKIEAHPVPMAELPELVWRGDVLEDVIALQLLRLHRWFTATTARTSPKVITLGPVHPEVLSDRA